jgi:hypothetical protein
MSRTITKAQLKEIEEARWYGERTEAYALLKEYTGIEARPYTAWNFYDEYNNYVGDSDNYSIRDLIENAYIDVVDESEDEQ